MTQRVQEMHSHLRTGLLVAFLASLSPASGPAQRAPGCDGRHQATSNNAAIEHDTIVGTPAGKLLRSPSLVCVNDTVYIAANVFPTDGAVDIGRRAMVLARVPGQPLPLPDGDFTFAYPSLVRRGESLDLFWGEFATAVVAPRDWLGSVTAIWHAEFHRGKWTQPELVLHGYGIYWAEEQTWNVTVDDGGRLHVVVPAALIVGHVNLIHVAGVTGDWKTQDLGFLANYASVVAMSANTLLVAYAAVSRPGDHGSIFTTKSSDGGAHWSPGVLLGSTPGRTMYSPELIRSGNAVQLLWSSGPGNFTIDRMWYSRSDNVGQTWLPPVETMLRQDSHKFLAVGTPCGDIVAFVQHFDGRELHLSQLTWTLGKPRIDSVLFANQKMTAFSGALQTDRGVDVVFSELWREGDTAKSVIARAPVCQDTVHNQE
jgi:hypothetical protein